MFLGEIADEGDFGANVVVELIGFDLVDGLLHHKFVGSPKAVRMHCGDG